MEQREDKIFVLLPRFNTKDDGLNYMSTSEYKFAFIVDDIIYSYDGIELSLTMDYIDVLIENMQFNNIKINKNLANDSELYLEDNILQYYKEFYI